MHGLWWIYLEKGTETNHSMGLEQEKLTRKVQASHKLGLSRNEWECLMLRMENDGFSKTVFTHPREGLRTKKRGLRTKKQRISYAGTHSALYLW